MPDESRDYSPAHSDDVTPQPRGRKQRILRTGIILMILYLAIAYIVAPFVWERYARHHPTFDGDPRITQTGDGHPGDPLNVSLIGTRQQIQTLMQVAGWYPAAALGLRSDLKIAADTVFERPDDEAPVSSLYLYGRKEDLAFEQPVDGNPRQRNHVRFWETSRTDSNNRPIWIGSASYDDRVGLSHTTGQITHHIAPDIDHERDHLFADLKSTGELAEFYTVANFHTQLEGHNGGGDRWFTDGAISVGVIQAGTKDLNKSPQ